MFDIDPINVASLDFVLFVLATLLAYYAVPARAQNWILLLASYFFLYTWSWQFPVAVAAVTLFNFIYARWLAGRPTKVRAELWAGVAVNVAVLLALKYFGVYSRGLNGLLQTWGVTDSVVIRILFPLGFSYYTLSNISYLVDVFLKQAQPTRSLLTYATFVAYFPKLTAGPIEVARDVLPQLDDKRVVDNGVISRSVGLITVGALRKIVLGDTLRSMVPRAIFFTPGDFAALDLFVYILAYGIVLYNDFAGYTQMVRGVSGLFGIELTYNFDNPLYSRNFTEIWDRWHRSLSQFMRKYVFFPLSRELLRRTKNPKHPLTIWLPPLVTMIASGFWHDISLSFAVWGLAHGTFQVYERLVQMRYRHPPADKQSLRRQWLTRVRTLALALAIQPLFYVPFDIGIATYAALVRNWNMPAHFDARIFAIIALTIAMELVEVRQKARDFYLRWPQLAQATALALIWLGVFLFTKADVGEAFIYQGF